MPDDEIDAEVDTVDDIEEMRLWEDVEDDEVRQGHRW
jgi:hypothetical protein